MNQHSPSTRFLAVGAVIAAAYAALTIALAPISYGPVQFRVSEALTILPFFVPGATCGLFLGCILANLFTGNVFDILFGSIATLLAGLMTARFGRQGNTVRTRILGCLMPVLFNAVIVGAVITWAYEGQNIFTHPGVFAFNALTVGLGEAGVLYLIGYPLMLWLPRAKFFRSFTESLKQE